MADPLTDDELAAVLTAIDNMGNQLTDAPPTRRAWAEKTAELLTSAEEKLRVAHGLPPTHPAGA